MDEIIQVKIKEQVTAVLEDLHHVFPLNEKKLLVIGCSTSEVIGQRIGTSGTIEAAKSIFEAVHDFSVKTGVQLAFQGCEHINRALIVKRQTASALGFEEVAVVPVRNAGGALATYAFNHLEDAIAVEEIKADAAVDIGDTLIGMHLKRVAVPVRPTVQKIGEAHVTMAMTRPKLIGGPRAKYGREC